ADAYDRAAIYGRDRNITSNANQAAWGGFDLRSNDFPGVIGPFGKPAAPLGFRLIPKLFFSGNSPPPHSATNVSTSPYYTNNVPYPDGNFALYNTAAVTAPIPAADRQSFYGSFTRDICDKYLTVFADFKYTRSFFDAAFAATGFSPDPFKKPSGEAFSPDGISVPIANPFNPFLGFNGRKRQAAISRVYVTLQNTCQFELPLTYFHLDGDLFNLPAGPVSFAIGLEYRGERWRTNPDSENASFDAIGTFNFQ